MNLENVRRDDWIVGGLALLLIILLIAAPWFDVTVGPFSSTFTATGAPDGWLGVIAVIVALALIVDLGIERLSPQTVIPSIAGSRTATRFILAAVAAVLLILKFILHIHFTGTVSFAWGFYADVIVAAALVFFALEANAGVIPGRPTGVRTGAPPPPTGGGVGGAGTPGAGGAAPPGGGAAPPPGGSGGSMPPPGGGGGAPPPGGGGGTAPPPGGGGGTAPPPGGGGGTAPPPGGGGGAADTPPGTGGPPPPSGSGESAQPAGGSTPPPGAGERPAPGL